MTCMLSDLKLPEPDVRLVVYNNTVVKVKLRCRNAQVSGETNQDRLVVMIAFHGGTEKTGMYWKKICVLDYTVKFEIFVLFQYST